MNNMDDQVTLCIPSARCDEVLLGVCLAATVGQKSPPVRCLLLDCSPKGIGKDSLLYHTLRYIPMEIFRVDTGLIHPYLGRNFLAKQVKTGWTWFLDDDLFPRFDCLSLMLRAAEKYQVGLVNGMKINMIRIPWEDTDFATWTSCKPRDQQIFYGDTANLLVRTNSWNSLTGGMSFELHEAGEDVATTARVIAKVGGMVAGDAWGWHLYSPDRASEWKNCGDLTRDEVKKNKMFLEMGKHLSPKDLDRLLHCFCNRIDPGLSKADLHAD